MLRAAGADVHPHDFSNDTPLYEACRGEDTKDLAIVQTLLRRHADVNLIYADKTPLDLAMESPEARAEIIQALKAAGAKTSKELSAQPAP